MKKGMLNRLLAVLLAALMLVGTVPMALAADAAPQSTDAAANPFPQGTQGSNSFRIPALVTLSDGTLVAAADARWNTTYDGGGLDTLVARSTDNGASWSHAFANYLGDNGNVYNGKNSTCFIDPALAVTANDTIYMLCDLYPYGVALNGDKDAAPVTDVGFADDGCLLLRKDGDSSYSYHLDLTEYKIYKGNRSYPVDGYTVDKYFNVTWTENGETKSSNLFYADSPFKVVRTGFLYLTSSTDGGQTWSAPKLLNLKKNTEQVCLVGPGRGLVTESGTIVFPVYSYNGSQESQKLSFISSANGTDWTRTDSFTGAQWSSESAVVELTDGALRFFYRNGTSALCYVDYSWTDGWGSAVNTGIATNSNTQISAITYSKTVDGKQVILVSCPTGPNGTGSNLSGASYRQNGKIFVFTVGEGNQLEQKSAVSVPSVHSTNSFMYSCLTERKDGSVAILYEDQESAWGTGDNCYYQMSFKTFTAEELGLSADSAPVEKPLSEACPGFLTEMSGGETQTLTVGESATWTTDNENVIQLEADTTSYSLGRSAGLTAESVKLTAVGPGTATITAKTDTATYTGTVTVAAVSNGSNADITLKVGETKKISVDLEDGQYVEWSTADGSYVGVAGKYDSTAKKYTDTGVIVGQQVTSAPTEVTGTVYNSDGTVARTQKWLVTVTKGDAGSNTYSRKIYVNVDKIENCDVYYSINAGELIKINGTGVLIDETKTGPFNIMYFAAPKEGYALTYMGATNTDNQYYTLANGNPDGTNSDAWPFQNTYNWDNYDGSSRNTTIFKYTKKQDSTTFHGLTWGLSKATSPSISLRSSCPMPLPLAATV